MSSGSEIRQRDKIVAIRCTEQERLELQKRASNSSMTVGDYVRSVALDARPLRTVRRHPVDQVLLSKILSELGKIGSNVNQIAHVLNASGRNRPALLDRAMTELSEARAVLFQALGVRPK